MATIFAPQINGSTATFAPQINSTPAYVPPDITKLEKHAVFTLMRNQTIYVTAKLL